MVQNGEKDIENLSSQKISYLQRGFTEFILNERIAINMEKIVFIYKNNTTEINEMLKENWKVKFIVPFLENVSVGGQGYTGSGTYGAYAVLEKIE